MERTGKIVARVDPELVAAYVDAVILGALVKLQVHGTVSCADEPGGRRLLGGTEREDVASVAECRPAIDIRYS